MPELIRPEFFDIFGALAFAFFICISLWGLKSNKPLPRWVLTIILIIGVLGLSVDIFWVYKGFFIK